MGEDGLEGTHDGIDGIKERLKKVRVRGRCEFRDERGEGLKQRDAARGAAEHGLRGELEAEPRKDRRNVRPREPGLGGERASGRELLQVRKHRHRLVHAGLVRGLIATTLAADISRLMRSLGLLLLLLRLLRLLLL